MKKFFTLAAAALMSIGMWAAYPTATTTYALEDLTVTEATLTYEKTGLSGDAQKLNKVLYIDVEVPCATAHGNLFMRSSSSNTGRFATIWGSNGTERDETRKVAMKNGNSDPIAFTADDILEADDKYYIRFSSADNNGSYFDYKITGFSYVLAEECVSKEIISTVETLTDAKINGVALDPNFLSELTQTGSVEVLNAYTTAPTVTFTKHVVITYDDESTKQSDVDVEVVAEELGSNQWTANISLNDGADDYSITMQRATAYTVTYKLADETVLGTEVVAAGGHPAEYAQYEVMPLSSFNGWYDSDYLEMVDLSQVVVNSDMSFYADFDKAYAQSIDFEGMVINNGKSYDVKSALTTNFYDYKNIDALDSLNNSKGAGRNEPYLGLKIKKNGGYLACNVLPDQTLRIKFGYVADPVLAIAGSDTLTLTPTGNKLADLVVPFAIEKLVKLQTTSDKTVVIKQIMIDQPIATWMYPITYAEAEHGTVSGWTIAFPNEEVQVNFTMDEGYTLVSCYANEQAVVSIPQVGEFFTMPAEAVTVSASFGDTATGIDNAEEEVKAVKVIRNGQLFIEKNGVLYDAQGAIVR